MNREEFDYLVDNELYNQERTIDIEMVATKAARRRASRIKRPEIWCPCSW